MRSLWKGAITFGLVNIPVALYPATTRTDLSFRQLHAKDAAPIAYRRICTAENVEVPWPEIAKGYEYAKGEFVVMTEDDFKNADVDANQTIDIRDFVPAEAIDFTYFEQPYYLEPTATGAKAYALLREALKRSGRVGIATFVLRQREHLAAVKVADEALVLTTMRFAHEIVPATELNVPRGETGLDRREVDLALQLVDTLKAEWEPDRYHDRYREALLAAIERKAEGRTVTAPAAGRKPPSKVVDLMQALQASLQARPARGARAPAAAKAPAVRRAARRKAS